jgi:hypothetical protein
METTTSLEHILSRMSIRAKKRKKHTVQVRLDAGGRNALGKNNSLRVILLSVRTLAMSEVDTYTTLHEPRDDDLSGGNT